MTNVTGEKRRKEKVQTNDLLINLKRDFKNSLPPDEGSKVTSISTVEVLSLVLSGLLIVLARAAKWSRWKRWVC